MSMISEQVKELRETAELFDEIDDGRRMLLQAADAIESLSAKVAAANMGQSDRYYNGGWILCEDRLPERESELLITSHEDGSVQIHAYRKDDGFILNWDITKPKSEVIAWQYLPSPYRP